MATNESEVNQINVDIINEAISILTLFPSGFSTGVRGTRTNAGEQSRLVGMTSFSRGVIWLGMTRLLPGPSTSMPNGCVRPLT